MVKKVRAQPRLSASRYKARQLFDGPEAQDRGGQRGCAELGQERPDAGSGRKFGAHNRLRVSEKVQRLENEGAHSLQGRQEPHRHSQIRQ